MAPSISRTSRTKYRIHNSFVERSRQIMNTSGIDKVSPSNRTENNTYNSNANHLIASDQFYDNLDRLKDEYYSFYHNEMKLEKAIKNFQRDKEHISNNMKELINKYNDALRSLEVLDNEFTTDHNEIIKKTVRSYRKYLVELGIRIEYNERLSIDTNKFISKIENSNDLDYIIKPLRELVVKLYRSFKSIKVPQNNSIQGYDNDDLEYSGVLINKKY
ncbi:hypothetical protein GOQ27_11585 [Clostridium sp. D2Q-11]|uniref:Uncharacterized protein n=1 Tax=Anaeromonas frigoriresistens TaxID=2683708 RepID=A0A942Z9A1_9FIRM|nr:hypothetical protein [Anaeromonas frigoriresistens]MBS4539108.1 hypothetical protein [Anaeromonas frigoriresistens]